MHPTGYLGVGNWQATAFQPDERIDVLDRTIRIRKFKPLQGLLKGTLHHS